MMYHVILYEGAVQMCVAVCNSEELAKWYIKTQQDKIEHKLLIQPIAYLSGDVEIEE